MGTKENTFLLGVGARAAGSYHLARALSKSKFFKFGFAKEYDVLQAMYNPQAHERREQIIHAFERQIFQPFGKWREKPNPMRLSFVINSSAYFDYFMWLLKKSPARATGDFSQNYLRLPPWILNKVREEFGRREIVTVPVFIVRNPVYLLKSLAEHRLQLKKVEVTYQNLIAEMLRIIDNPWEKSFFSFDETANKLRDCFGDNCCFLLFEDIIESNAVSQLELKLGFQLGNIASQVRRLDVKDATPQLQLSEYNYFEEMFDGVIENCEKEFPEFDIWRHWRHLD